jgi:3-oxoacyl-[acyl-carrier protein] reductase
MSKKIYVVFGASGGIGSSLAEKVSSLGNTVYLIGRDAAKLSNLSSRLGQPFFVVDPFDEKKVEDLLKQIADKEGALDSVINCIGSFYIKPLHLTPFAEFNEVMKINMGSSFCITKGASLVMSLQKKGSIVLCSSVAAITGLASHEAIAAAKGAIASFVRASAASLATKGVRVNAVAPGLTNTPLASPITASEASLKASIAFHPMGRIAEASEVADAIYWLTSPQSSWVTGQVIPVDGGLTSLRIKMGM